MCADNDENDLFFKKKTGIWSHYRAPAGDALDNVVFVKLVMRPTNGAVGSREPQQRDCVGLRQ